MPVGLGRVENEFIQVFYDKSLRFLTGTQSRNFQPVPGAAGYFRTHQHEVFPASPYALRDDEAIIATSMATGKLCLITHLLKLLQPVAFTLFYYFRDLKCLQLSTLKLQNVSELCHRSPGISPRRMGYAECNMESRIGMRTLLALNIHVARQLIARKKQIHFVLRQLPEDKLWLIVYVDYGHMQDVR